MKESESIVVESSKILTVSYGTFSCTLEGFEDSFSTMKAIAEYFRDLAADDRYFGAEPPTPDAEMLGRIAEREIARRVETRLSDDGVHLRAAPAAEADEPTEPAMPPVLTPPVAEDDTLADVDAALATSSPAEATDVDDIGFEDFTPLQETPAHPDPSSVAAKLQRIQAVVGQTDALDGDEDDIGVNDIAAPTDAADVADAPETSEDDSATVVENMDMPTDDAELFDAASEPDTSIEEPDTAMTADALQADATPAADDLAAASEADEPSDITAEDTADMSEPELAEATDQTDETMPDAAASDTTEVAAPMATDTSDDAGDDTDAQISQVLRNLERAGATVPDEFVLSPNTAEDAASDVAVSDVLTPAVSEDDTAQAAPEPATAPAKPSLRARILRVSKKKAPVEPVIAPAPPASEAAESQAAPMADLDGADDLSSAFAENDGDQLSPDAEADLQAELAALTNDADDMPAATDTATDIPADVSEQADDAPDMPLETPETAEAAPEPPAPAPSKASALPATNDADMSRIMDQADEELSNPEGSRRRAAIAQLKAAVAATEAARQLGDDKSNQTSPEDAFRDDLSKVVRPRPAAKLTTDQPSRAERPRPGPLKLVASQRVDVADNTAETVRPRRVASSEAGAGSDSSSFAEFAENMGATELPDLLEAAAAYTAFVEGENEFSRPQIMRKVQASSDTAFSREDGLRSFGTLLRQGRISKAGNGRFQVSDQTRFKPEQKAG